MELDELLRECVDALSVPTWDGDCRDEHLASIEEAIARESTPEDTRELLRSAATIFREHQKMNLMSLALEDNSSAGRELAAVNQSKMGCSWPRFIYHGTIYGRLADILKNGLIPGKVPVWKSPSDVRHFADGGVSFDTTWRGALGWAEIAHHSSKGHRDGLHRTPAIIRVVTSGLTLEPDKVANKAGCLMARKPVPVNGAHVIVGKVRGFPKWQPLSDVLAPRQL